MGLIKLVPEEVKRVEENEEASDDLVKKRLVRIGEEKAAREGVQTDAQREHVDNLGKEIEKKRGEQNNGGDLSD